MKMLLFDIDGTLLLTGGAGKTSLNLTFKEIFGIDNAWGKVVPDGKTDPMIINEVSRNVLGRALDGREQETVLARYLEHFEIQIEKTKRFRLMPGITELLPELRKRNKFHLGIATGNVEKAAHLKLQRGGLSHYFHFGGYGSDSVKRAELTHQAVKRGEAFSNRSFKRDEIFVIGDTIHDIEAGKALGTKTVAVATGSTTKAELSKMKPDYLFDALSDWECVLKIFEIA